MSCEHCGKPLCGHFRLQFGVVGSMRPVLVCDDDTIVDEHGGEIDAGVKLDGCFKANETAQHALQ